MDQRDKTEALFVTIGELVAGVAHEVRTPLFGISALLDAFEARFGDQSQFQTYLGLLRLEVERLNILMRDLLDYGKPPALALVEGSLEEVLGQAIRTCLPRAERLKVRIENRVTHKVPPVRLDPARMVQVFQNLIDNALVHSSADSAVTIEAMPVEYEKQAWIECFIRDSGPGFRPEDLSRIFEPFFTRRLGGTGLGLSIAQRIVEAHGGHIFASNRPEGGAVICIRFPLSGTNSSKFRPGPI